jgi:A/G-specific adenine glycosylase
LPWHKNPSPYHVWLSEVMLQQTQVSTVIPYFQRFLNQFPDWSTLAMNPLDAVLSHWAGLGYYARARHLHQTAQIIHKQGLPTSWEGWQDLPGIGATTAAAIMVFAFGGREAILDGNVKRVIARFDGLQEPLNTLQIKRHLWKRVHELLPLEQMVSYTQGLMDLGSLICVRGQPRCPQCPLIQSCQAHRLGLQNVIPLKPNPVIHVQPLSLSLWILRHADQVWLEKRPTRGIWGGLWCFPVDKPQWLKLESIPSTHPITHRLAHRMLTLTPYWVSLPAATIPPTRSEITGDWFSITQALTLGTPKPVQNLLKNEALSPNRDAAPEWVNHPATPGPSVPPNRPNDAAHPYNQ